MLPPRLSASTADGYWNGSSGSSSMVPAVGIHFVITADRRAAVPSALTSVVTTRLVLRMAERDDYALSA